MTTPKASRAAPGFSIVETLVAISILLLAITGPMAFAQSSLRAAAYARDQVTAFFLAQDAIEFVKHVRDENSLTGDRANWLSGLAACRPSQGGETCMVSSADVTIGSAEDDSEYAEACHISSSAPPEGCRLWVETGPDSKLYGVQDAGGNRARSRFVRTVLIEAVPGVSENDEVAVTVRIYWQTHPMLPAREIVVREDIMNWIQ